MIDVNRLCPNASSPSNETIVRAKYLNECEESIDFVSIISISSADITETIAYIKEQYLDSASQTWPSIDSDFLQIPINSIIFYFK